MSLMWMPPQTTRPPLRTARSAAGTSAPTGANRIAASSGSGGVFVGAARPDRAEPAREALRRLVARPGEGEDLAALEAADLRQDMRGGAEAVEADPLARPRRFQAAPADQPGAQQRRGRRSGRCRRGASATKAASASICEA